MNNWWKTECDHEWEVIDHEEGTYRTSTCIICGCWRWEDFVNNKDELTEPDLTDEDLQPEDR